MRAKQLFQAGQLTEAIQALGAELRDNPADTQRRTFLFELLCFAGEYDRAEKQLNVLAGDDSQKQMGAVLYHSALHAERLRHDLFEKKNFPLSEAKTRPGTLNGQAFETIEDADPRIGPRLELFAAGAYLWIPFQHITSIEMQAPKRLRDTLWAAALVRTGPEFREKELGEVLLPAIAPFSWKSADGNVKLGRATEWIETEDGDAVPVGQKMLLVDGEEFPFLEIRKLEFAEPEASEVASP